MKQYCFNLSSVDSVHEEFQDLCQEAKDEFDDMLKIIDDYLDLSKKALD
jgi:hypothetical protein